MKRSDINRAFRDATAFFTRHGWALPPNAKWDITDFGLGDFARYGLTLVNLAEEPEYCEKLMYARQGQTTPWHMHARKKEDIICRAGVLTLELAPAKPGSPKAVTGKFTVKVNGESRPIAADGKLVLPAGSRVTLTPGIWHAFYPTSSECVIGEVSTANDDQNDNFFLDPEVGRFPGVEEDAASAIRLLSDRS